MPLRFGTDGVRGVAGRDLTPEVVTALGRAAAAVLGKPGAPFVVGRDTRWSGPMLQAALSAGLAASGFDVLDLGVAPTPAVAAVAVERGAPAAVVSASHNPYADNGVKLFAAGGRKLGRAEEEAVEALCASPGAVAEAGLGLLEGEAIGRISAEPEALDRYCEGVVACLEGRRLGGLKIVVDCANGASVRTAVPILEAAEAEVGAVIGSQPDGRNINAGCGSTDTSALSRAVRRCGADMGLALDGDADRVIAVDAAGDVVDGDRLLALFALDLHSRGLLHGGGVVVTVMTNLGFRRAMAGAGIEVAETPVGDRHVLEALEQRGWALGGEQSGHIVFRDLATTGDGLLTGLLLGDLVVRAGRPLSELAGAVMDAFPQAQRNVEVSDPGGLEGAQAVWSEVAAIEAELGGDGRVVLRASGTEKVVRVMVEALREDRAAGAADRLAAAVRATLGG
ncbi:MAG TPA: phosphoglucosamine mutase [Acidimicrobiales bacterium]|nr:phosphoglucosamine mutase [Acidimicrobiales bacterium]